MAHSLERSLDVADVVAEIATRTGHSSAQIAIAWTLLNPAIAAPMLGARTLKQLEDNLGALQSVVERRGPRAP
jgi:aryl-alcohol dehydrogenase-like predicted oxidoreductase